MPLLKHILRFAAFVIAFAVFAETSVFPQNGGDCPEKISAKTGTTTRQKAAAGFISGSVTGSLGMKYGGDVEKAILVNENVYVSFCVSGATVKVNGWNRSEVRAFVKGRDDIGFKVRQKSGKDKNPSWIEIRSLETDENGRQVSSCVSGQSLELDVPYNASVTITGASGETSVVIDEVKAAKVEITSGDISVSNIKNGIDAQTDIGGVSVMNSNGKMELKTTAGNIVAYGTDSNDIGDFFRAKTHSGAVTMQAIGQKEVEARSFSGSISYIGDTQDFGNYVFATQNGMITFAVPGSASFKLKAAYGGSFSSDLPLNNIYKEASTSAVYLTGSVGTDNGALVSVNSYSGSIRILRSDLDKPAVMKF